mmetsp:Transcript_58848/g.137880  ORF Transcript_58848/g.137880 Transcript_58848/m.137880 type:complete len:815 (-) Transcript_58848:224-2668(-)
MPKGPDYATVDALGELKAELRQMSSNAAKRDDFVRGQISKLEQLISAQKQDMDYSLSQQKEKVEAHEEGFQQMQSETQVLRQEFTSEVAKIQDLQAKAESLEKDVGGVQSLAKQNYEALQEMQKQAQQEHMEELKKARQDLEKHALEAARKDADEVSTKAKKDLDGATTAVRGEMSKGLQELQANLTESMKQSFAALEKNMAETRAALEAQCKAIQKETQEKHEATEKSLTQRIVEVESSAKQLTEEQVALEKKTREQREEVIYAELEKLDKEFKGSHEELKEETRQGHEKIHEVRREAEDRSAAVLAENRANIELLQGEATRLNAFCAGVSGLPTRQVEWRLAEGTLKQLEKVQDREPVDDPSLVGDAQASFFSPPFEAAGTRGMQLELRVHTRRSAHGEEDDPSGNQCSLYLWACAGLQLVFRLFLGTESVVLRHTFDGKSPCGLKRMGSIFEQKSVDGSLRLGIEIHESLVESTASGSGGTSNPMTVQAADREDPHGPVDGELAVQRYVNHRLLELMQSQGRAFLDQLHKKVDVMRSRAVRRVQWRLENGPLLYQTFAKEQAVRSTAFQAAGISGMQFVFYPQGCAGARPGFCSIFLSCPPNCTMRCWLLAGRLRKEARQEPEDQPDLLGRVNFARFENIIDPVDETVELVLEIEEAQQGSKATTSTQPLQIEDSRADMSASEFSKQGGALQSMSEPSKEVRIERTDVQRTKIQHNSGKPPADGAVQQLPSIWTTQGFHSFGDIEEGTSTRANTASTAKGTSTQQSSPTTPRVPGAKAGQRKANGRAPMSAREPKYKEYNQANQPLPQPSY